VEARQYVDSCCVKWGKPVIDCGTSGLRGHVQVALPRLSESYGSSADPPDPTLPICSVKSFPEKVRTEARHGKQCG
jgi:molybdopterin/thiamine biosynthesis adenylyltransferase